MNCGWKHWRNKRHVMSMRPDQPRFNCLDANGLLSPVKKMMDRIRKFFSQCPGPTRMLGTIPVLLSRNGIALNIDVNKGYISLMCLQLCLDYVSLRMYRYRGTNDPVIYCQFLYALRNFPTHPVLPTPVMFCNAGQMWQCMIRQVTGS